MAFQCSPFTGTFYEQSGQVPARRHGGLSGLSDRRVTKEELFLFGVAFAIQSLSYYFMAEGAHRRKTEYVNAV